MLNIQKQFIKYNFTPNTTRKIQYIVIHDTGDPNGTAQNEHDYFSGGDRQASADFFVDDKNIIQIIDYTKGYSWHCGDGHGKYGITNQNSIGVEMCLITGKQDIVTANTIELVKFLMKELNIDINHVVRHYDASHKMCPNSFSANNWTKWTEFKNKLSGSSTTMPISKQSTSTQPKSQIVVNTNADVQLALNKLGYNCGNVDGVMGTKTTTQLCKFQKANKLTVDGIAGQQTKTKLTELVNKVK